MQYVCYTYAYIFGAPIAQSVTTNLRCITSQNSEDLSPDSPTISKIHFNIILPFKNKPITVTEWSSSRRNSSWTALPLKMAPIGRSEMSVTTALCCVTSQNSQHLRHIPPPHFGSALIPTSHSALNMKDECDLSSVHISVTITIVSWVRTPFDGILMLTFVRLHKKHADECGTWVPINISLIKDQFVVIHWYTVLQETKKLGTCLTDQHLNTSSFYKNVRRSNFLVEARFWQESL